MNYGQQNNKYETEKILDIKLPLPITPFRDKYPDNKYRCAVHLAGVCLTGEVNVVLFYAEHTTCTILFKAVSNRP